MNKVMKISNNLNIFVGVARTIFKSAAIVIAVCVVILLFVSPHHDIWRNANHTLQLGLVTLDLIVDGAVPAEVTRNGIIGGLIFCIPLLLFGAKCLRIVQDILTPMSQGKPFDQKVSLSLRKLSFITLIVGTIYQAGTMLLSALQLNNVNLTNLFNPEFVAGYTVEFIFDTNFILVFAVLYLMSHVFRYGEELQQLSDETL